jgi:hypothetical protein
MLWPERTRVWLEPDEKTKAWLSWSVGAKGDPLRFVFPDGWGMGAWTPDGARKQSFQGLGNEWWTFLYGDPNAVVIPTSRMVKITAPDQFTGRSTRQGIGLFGDFTTFTDGSAYSRNGNMDSQCLIDDEVSVEGGPSTRDCYPDPAGASTASQITELTIKFLNVPLDLPGSWMIGITANQYPAKYFVNTQLKYETEVNGFDEYSPELMLGPWDLGYYNGYSITEYTFDAYIIIATPCYNADPESCKN